ncbi:MAG: helix-turn-helix domain-containing protein [Candidatus Wallacebacter cryptica]|jgi:cytoskeleton protein RodZ|nr:helix-turn-helix domain-containing protein [Bacillota bacterium]
MKELGDLLRQAREEQQMTIEEISEKTKIRTAYLEAIEAGDQSALPDEVYVRGFLRIYAKVLKIDPDEIIRLYDQDDQKIMARIQQPDDQRQSVLERRRARRRKKRIRFFLFVVLVIAGVGLYYYYLSTIGR